MQITEVRVKLVDARNEKLRAFCSITIDNDFVIRDLKVIEGAKGAFVAMPSRKLMARCPKCGTKNPIRANYCNECGKRMPAFRVPRDGERVKLHADIAHPINSRCREMVQKRVLEAFQREADRSCEPGYRPARYEEVASDYDGLLEEAEKAADRGSRTALEAEEEAEAEPEDNFGAGLWP